jgi:uncharacterized protein (DUF488 family)
MHALSSGYYLWSNSFEHIMRKTAPPPTFYTLGYQSHSLSTMIKVLAGHHVGVLVDVRQNPVSRKRGFSRTQLEKTIPSFGITYLHCPELGTPPSIRKIYLNTGNIPKALTQYEKHLRSRQGALRLLLQKVSTQRFCLLCLEADHKSCHRSIIAEILTEMTGCQPIHLH